MTIAPKEIDAAALKNGVSEKHTPMMQHSVFPLVDMVSSEKVRQNLRRFVAIAPEHDAPAQCHHSDHLGADASLWAVTSSSTKMSAMRWKP
jgi:hypothetical protein